MPHWATDLVREYMRTITEEYRPQEDYSPSQSEPDEQTPLLTGGRTASHNGHNTSSSSNFTLDDEHASEDDTHEAEFEHLIVRTRSISYEIDPEGQEVSVFRCPRIARLGTHLDPRHGKQSLPDGFVDIFRSTIEEGEVEEEVPESKTRYLAGVSEPRFWLIFASLTISYFVSCFDGTIMISSHPVITSYFHKANSASWLSTSFLLTSTAIQPLFGRLSDAVGRKGPYIITVFIFLVGTIWCALAGNITSFIVARACCGLGAGGMLAIGAIMLSDLVPIEIRSAYQSYMNVIFGAGAVSGVALGGAIADHWGWRWEFWIQLPFLVVCLCLAIWTIPADLGKSNESEKPELWQVVKTFDYMGSLLLTATITFLILGLNLGGNVFDWSHPFIIFSLTIAAISFPWFLFVESVARLPIIPIYVLRHNPRSSIILSNFFGAMCINTITFNLPLYFQAILLESATASGLRMITPTIIASLVGTASGLLITWTKRLKWPLVTGALFLLLGCITLAAMYRGCPAWMYLLCIVPSSVGQGLIMPASFMAILVASEQSEQAVVTSTLMLWRSLGYILGVAISSLVLQNTLLWSLERVVTGPEKNEVIQQVRESVHAILSLESTVREQVIHAYVGALRATFLLAALLAFITLLFTVSLKIPRLGARERCGGLNCPVCAT